MRFPKPSKNRLGSVAKKTRHGEYLFDSRLEAKLHEMLRLRELGGELRELRVKPNVHLTRARILMIPDFAAVEVKTGKLTYFEAKGFETEVWRLKRRIWKHYGPGPLVVFKACRGGGIMETERIEVTARAIAKELEEC